MADQDGVDFVLSTGIGTRPRVGRWVSGEVVLMMADKMHTRPCYNEYTCQVYIAISDINQISNINWSDTYSGWNKIGFLPAHPYLQQGGV